MSRGEALAAFRLRNVFHRVGSGADTSIDRNPPAEPLFIDALPNSPRVVWERALDFAAVILYWSSVLIFSLLSNLLVRFLGLDCVIVGQSVSNQQGVVRPQPR